MTTTEQQRQKMQEENALLAFRYEKWTAEHAAPRLVWHIVKHKLLPKLDNAKAKALAKHQGEERERKKQEEAERERKEERHHVHRKETDRNAHLRTLGEELFNKLKLPEQVESDRIFRAVEDQYRLFEMGQEPEVDAEERFYSDFAAATVHEFRFGLLHGLDMHDKKLLHGLNMHDEKQGAYYHHLADKDDKLQRDHKEGRLTHERHEFDHALQYFIGKMHGVNKLKLEFTHLQNEDLLPAHLDSANIKSAEQKLWHHCRKFLAHRVLAMSVLYYTQIHPSILDTPTTDQYYFAYRYLHTLKDQLATHDKAQLKRAGLPQELESIINDLRKKASFAVWRKHLTDLRHIKLGKDPAREHPHPMDFWTHDEIVGEVPNVEKAEKAVARWKEAEKKRVEAEEEVGRVARSLCANEHKGSAEQCAEHDDDGTESPNMLYYRALVVQIYQELERISQFTNTKTDAVAIYKEPAITAASQESVNKGRRLEQVVQDLKFESIHIEASSTWKLGRFLLDHGRLWTAASPFIRKILKGVENAQIDYREAYTLPAYHTRKMESLAHKLMDMFRNKGPMYKWRKLPESKIAETWIDLKL
ncbi:unnamed protein product [Amoebophrya sp. A120]|nr:unnamed protein product [Amoebophrya sp. A120]|eukprot:GSA120T00012504001.1